MVKDFFPTYPNYKPLVFVDKPFNFNFFKSLVFRSSPPTEDIEYIIWLNKMEENKKYS